MSSCCYSCVLILLHNVICPHAAIHVSSYCYITLYMCPHAAIHAASCVLILLYNVIYVSSCCYLCVLILLYVSSYCYLCVLVLISFWNFSFFFSCLFCLFFSPPQGASICSLTSLLYMCPRTHFLSFFPLQGASICSLISLPSFSLSRCSTEWAGITDI